MFAAHFGVAAAVKAKSPETPLWPLMLGTQLIDILFVPLLLTNVEKIVPQYGQGYAGSVIYAFYSHSLVGTLLLAILAGLLCSRLWGKISGMLIGSVIFSHWLLDLLVHRQDLPILPGNLGGLPLLGLGVWNYPWISMAIEGLIIVIGGAMYIKSLFSSNIKGKTGLRISASLLMAVSLILALVTDVIGI